MRTAFIIALCLLGATEVRAQVNGAALLRSSAASAPKPKPGASVSVTEFRSRKNPNLVYSGALVQSLKGVNPLQLINPLAPVAYGSGGTTHVASQGLKPAEGVKLFAIGF